VLAEELIRRHLQDHGDYPKALVVDLWGSATMRTAGEEFAMALHLLGAKPVWDMASDRVTGLEILPLAMMDRPRIDVTLRVSGLFRDAFPMLPLLFGQAVRALSRRDEPDDWNPLPVKTPGRVCMDRRVVAMVCQWAMRQRFTPMRRAERRVKRGCRRRNLRSIMAKGRPIPMACAAAWPGPMPLSTFRIWRKAICCWRPIMPRMKAALPLPRR
jgi:hypothetical protein